MTRLSVRGHKYNAKKTIVDGITFDSKIEAARYCELKLLLQSGEISNLKLQPKFVLQDKFTDVTGKKHRAIQFQADFEYTDNGQRIIEDVKGMETVVFKIKKKLFLYRYKCELRIVTRKDINMSLLHLTQAANLP